MVKIAYFVSMISGLETFVKNEVEALCTKGFDISLFVTKYSKSPGFEPNSAIKLHKANLAHVFTGVIVTGFLRPRLFVLLLREALIYGAIIEFVLATSWNNRINREAFTNLHAAFGDRKFFVAYFVHRFTNIPLSVAIHAHEIYAQPNEKLFRHAMLYVNKVLTISEINKKLLIEKYDIDHKKIEMIRLPIDTDFWQTKKRINVLTVARYTPRKGWFELIEAAKILKGKFRFVAVGFGDLDMEKMINDAGVEESFTIYPKLNSNQIRTMMQLVDIFCLPSKSTVEEGSEGIPVVLMEAMSMGLQIVTTSDGSISELVDREIVEPGNVNSLVNGLNKVADSLIHEGNEMALFNRNRVCEMHGQRNIELVVNFFQQQV